MKLKEAMKALQAAGKPGTAKIYARHGVEGPAFGVNYGDLGKLKKQIGVDQALALALWRSGNHDARILATQIADPEVFRAAELDAWVKACENYVLCDAVAALTSRTPGALKHAKRWIGRKAEFVAAAGWNVIASLAVGGGLPEDEAAGLLTKIEAGISRAPNRTRHSMNGALIAIGGSLAPARSAALKIAKAIGKVEVDHGETGCKTPDATGYIQKMAKRGKTVRGKKLGARASSIS